VGLGQGGQDADHHQVGVGRGGPLLGRVEAGADPVLEAGQAPLGEPARGHIDFDIELSQLGDEVRIGDLSEYAGVAHRRVAGPVDQIELDLQPGQRRPRIEGRATQHPGEHVEIAPDLVPITRAILTAERLRLDIPTHRDHLRSSRVGRVRAVGAGRCYRVWSSTQAPSRPRKCAMNRSCSAGG
jgi:hypothetical protein